MGKKSRRKSPKVQEVAKPVAFAASGKPLLDPNIFGPIPEPNQVKSFWDWFAMNEDVLFHITTAGSCMDDYAASYSKFGRLVEGAFERVFGADRKIVFEYTLGKEIRDLIITPDGIKERFNLTLALYDGAPTFTRWNVVACRSREEDADKTPFGLGPAGETMASFQSIFDPENVRYLLTNVGRERNGLLKVVLFFENCKGNEEMCIRAGFIFLDHILGEYDVCVHLFDLEFKSQEDKRFDLSSPLTSLVKDFDMRLSKRLGKRPKEGWIALRNTYTVDALRGLKNLSINTTT